MTQSATLALAEERLDRTELLRLYDQAAPAIRRLGARLLGREDEVDDLVHDVFVVACSKRGEVRRSGAMPFLFGTAVKVAAGMRRRARVRRLLGFEPPAVEVELRTPEWASEMRDARRIVYAVLDGIPEKRRAVFILHEMQGMTAEEIAAALGCPSNTVFSRLHKVRREFTERLERHRKRNPGLGGEGIP